MHDPIIIEPDAETEPVHHSRHPPLYVRSLQSLYFVVVLSHSAHLAIYKDLTVYRGAHQLDLTNKQPRPARPRILCLYQRRGKIYPCVVTHSSPLRDFLAYLVYT